MVKRNTVASGVVDKVRLRPVVFDHGLPSCALDVADEGPQSLREIGRLMGLSRSQVLDIERAALGRARALLEADEVGAVNWFGE